MSSNSDGVIRIPIEIKTDDIQELQNIIKDISDADAEIKSIKPKRGKVQDSTSRAPLRISSFEERGGIFGGSDTSTPIRDRTSSAPYQRGNPFGELKSQVANLEREQQATQSGLDTLISGLFGVSLSGGASGAAQAANTAMTTTTKAMGGGFSIASFAARLAGPIGAALIAVGFVQQIVGILQGPGGLFDRRFKRKIEEEQVKFTDLREKAEIAAGRRVLRVSTISNLRDSSQSFSNLDTIKRGVLLYDTEGHNLSKGTGVYEI